MKTLSFSRRRGGDPSIFSNFSLSMEFFPHTRGWSYPGYRNWTGFHVYFSRRRGGDPVDTSTSWTIPLFFPQTRGWSYRCLYSLYGSYVFPAHAGVILHQFFLCSHQASFSRTRGCDPGDIVSMPYPYEFFPHTRGWSRCSNIWTQSDLVFPARAGDWLHKMRYKKNILIENW